MERASAAAQELRERIATAEKELQALREQLAKLESGDTNGDTNGSQPPDREASKESRPWRWPLARDEYERYGRQLILPGLGVEGQLRLKQSRVLVVGAGGLGCPAAVYLAGAGVGTLGVVDGDVVEPSNLHRQIAHATSRVGLPKADSLVAHLRALNPLPTYVAHRQHLTPETAEEVVGAYDVVLDCTDRPASRYLVSDACVLLGKPLVSAAALRTDGQLIVLNCPPLPPGSPSGAGGGPCYRCVFPRPPPADAVVSCGEGGVLGPVVGTMGVLQAAEAIRIIVRNLHRRPAGDDAQAAPLHPPSLLLFSSPLDGAPSFRSVRMRGRRPDCPACSAASTLTLDGLRSGSLDYVQFCGAGSTAPGDILAPEERISPAAYDALRRRPEREPHLLLDVREPEHFAVAALEGAVNVPYSRIQRAGGVGGKEEEEEGWIPHDLPPSAPIYVVCRVGENSQLVARRLKERGLDRGGERFVGDIRGGMRAWKAEVDDTVPFT